MAMRQQREKVEQQQILNLLRSIGGKPYVLGVRRRRGDFQGTNQTPGIPDVYVFLPKPPLNANRIYGQALWIEVKATGGRMRPEQVQFRDECGFSDVAHVVGGVDAVIAFLVVGGWLKRENLPHYRVPLLRAGVDA